MYKYTEKIPEISKAIERLGTITTIDKDIATNYENLETSKVLKSWCINLSTYINIDSTGATHYAHLMTLVQNELLSVLHQSQIMSDIRRHSDGLSVKFLVNYLEDIHNIHTIACYMNTILKMFQRILKGHSINLKYGIGMDLVQGYSFFNQGYNKKIYSSSFFSFVSNRETVNIDYELAKALVKKGNERTMCMTKLFYDNVIESLKKENKDSPSWIRPEIILTSVSGTYTSNVIITSFDKAIDDL